MQEEIHPQVEKVPQGAQVRVVGGSDEPLELSSKDIRETFLDLARAVTTQVN